MHSKPTPKGRPFIMCLKFSFGKTTVLTVTPADLNEYARAVDASREANGAVYGERLK